VHRKRSYSSGQRLLASPVVSMLVALVALSMVLVASSRDAGATTLMYLTADEHAESSAAVVVATPRRVESYVETISSSDAMFTYTILDVHEVLKGDIRADRPLVLKHPGGRIGGAGRNVDGTPQFEVGTAYLLFLAADPRPPYECYFVQSFELGVWTLERRRGELWAVRGASAHAFRGASYELARAPDEVRLDRVRAIAARTEKTSAPQVPPSYAKATVASPTIPRSSFTLLGQPSRWFEPDTGAPVVLYLNPANFLYAGSLSSAVEWAMAQWSGVSGSSLRLAVGGPTDVCGFETVNHVSSIAVDCRNEVPGSGCRASGVIAIGGPRTYYDEHAIVSETEFRRIRSGDVVLNDPVAGSGGECHLFDDQRSLNAVVAHEIGHVLGLGHSDAGETGDRPTMYGYLVPGMDTLHEDDREAVCYVYPATEPPLVPELMGLQPSLVEQGVETQLVVEARHVTSADARVAIRPSSGLTWNVVDVEPLGGDRSRLELVLSVDGDAPIGARSLVVATPGGESNAQAFVVSEIVAPSDLRAVRERGSGRRRSVLLSWTDTSAVETGIRVERLDPRTGAFVQLAGGYLGPNATSFRDERARRKRGTYRVAFVDERSGAVSYSNAASVAAR
jgi:hypothetical protein